MAGTDRQAIVDLVAPGVGKAGNGTLVGPAYSAYYSEDQIAYDPAKAKQLLADAGYARRPRRSSSWRRPRTRSRLWPPPGRRR